MKLNIYLFIAFLISMSSCSKNNANDPNKRLEGKWNLIYVSCECQPVDLEVGQHIWYFDLAARTLTVENNVTEELHTIPDSGIYDLTVTENTLTLLSVTYDYYFDDDELIVEDHPEVDGPRIQLVRD